MVVKFEKVISEPVPLQRFRTQQSFPLT